MTVRKYQWDEEAAPQILTSTGAPGDGEILNILKKCLVTGFGTRIPMGWSEQFSGTNKSVFRQGGSGMVVRVRNDLSAGAQIRCRGAESASDVDTLVDPFPTIAQVADNSNQVIVSPAAVGAHKWIVIGDARTMYMFAKAENQAHWVGWMFGDFYTFKANDAYKVALIGGLGNVRNSLSQRAATNIVNSAHYIARAANQTTKSLNVGKHVQNIFTGTALYQGRWSFPSVVNPARLTLTRIYLHEILSREPRGYLRGLYWTPHVVNGWGDLDTFQGITPGPLADRSFLILTNVGTETGDSSVAGAFILETSNTWDTN